MRKAESSLVQAISKAHTALLKDLQKLSEAVHSASDNMAELRSRLNATQAHLIQHFRFEEQNGYLDDVRKREPRLERTIQQLAEEHSQLAQSLVGLIGETKTATRVEDGFREEVQRWTESVRQHENRETDVVQDAFNVDIGAED